MWTSVLHDLRFAVRSLLRVKGFTALALLTAGMAIGATTAVYSTVDWMLNRPPGGVMEPARLVTLRTTDEQLSLSFAFPQYESIREVQDVFTDLAAYAKLSGVVSTDTRADQVVFEFVTGNYFPMLGLRPTLGRVIGPDDDVAGGAPGVVLAHAFWQSHFGGDPAAIGSGVTLNGQRCVIIGVLPRTFEGYSVSWNGPTSVWLPIRSYTAVFDSNMLTRTGQSGIFFPIIGRLRPGVSLEAAEARAQAWVPLLTPEPGDRYIPTKIVAQPSSDTRIGARDATQAFFWILFVVCTLVLLAACFNIANFLIGRAVSRRREIAVRTAIGATRWRIARQLFVEALVLGLSAGAVGIAVAVVLIRLSAATPNIFFGVPVTTEAAIDGRLAAVAVTLGLLSAIVFGLLPAVLASVRNPVVDLKNPKPGWSWSRIRVSTRQVLMVLQVALSVVLASTAGLYAHSLTKIAAMDSGYAAPEQVLVARVVPPTFTAEQGRLFYDRLFADIREMSGVVSASIGWNPPYSIGRNFFTLPGGIDPPIEAGSTAAAPHFFQTLGIRMVAGREFDGSENERQHGAIINKVLADRLWPNQSAVGQRVMYGQVERTVTGVTTEERCRDILGPPEPCAYQPFPPNSLAYLRVRVEGDPMAFVPRLRTLIRDIHPQVALAEEKTLDRHVRDLTAAQRMSAMATAALAVLGVVMLAAGCVSLFMSMVRDSVREIAIRMAIGATPGQLTRRILIQGVVLTLTGLILGAFASRFVAMRVVAQLHEITAWDPVTWVAVPSLIALVSLLSVYAAAVVASRTEPSRLLRAE